MAKRFSDTNKYKKPFIRSLPGPYKLLWDYLYLDCDHTGIWIVDFEIAQVYIGNDMPVNKQDALKFFNNSEKKIIEIDNGKKWFIVPFIEFQYGKLNSNIKVHLSVIQCLEKYDLLNIYKELVNPYERVNEGLESSFERAKDKDKDKDKDIKGGMGGNDFIDQIIEVFQKCYLEINQLDYVIVNKEIERSSAGKLLKLYKNKNPGDNSQETLDGFRKYFNMVIQIKDQWIQKNMSIPLILKRFNEINKMIKDGSNRNNYKGGTTDAELAAIMLKHWG